MLLSTHFDLEELTFSEAAVRLGIDNTPSPLIVENLTMLCLVLLEPIREFEQAPLLISSGFRCPQLNHAIGGSKTSDHMHGLAADFRIKHRSPYQVCSAVMRSELPFNQLIHEFGRWVHISLPKADEPPKRQLLTATLEKGRTIYNEGILLV